MAEERSWQPRRRLFGLDLGGQRFDIRMAGRVCVDFKRGGAECYCRDSHAETAPMGMRNMAKNLAPIEVDPVAIALPIADTIIRQTMCNERSLVLADDHVTQIDTRKVAN